MARYYASFAEVFQLIVFISSAGITALLRVFDIAAVPAEPSAASFSPPSLLDESIAGFSRYILHG